MTNKQNPIDIIARIPKDHKWQGNILQKMAEEIVRYTIPIEEVVKFNLSETILREIKREIKNKEIVKIQINAKPRLSKSTVGIAIAQYMDFVLKDLGQKDEKIEFGMRNIARDQNEKMKKLRNPDLMFDVIITDENNSSESTGENATVEEAQRKTVSDVQAGRYIHEINICPEGSMDHNTDIKIEIRNKENGLSHTRIYYHLKSMSYYGWVMVGIADFDVRSLIKNWLNVEPRFMKYLKDKNGKDKEYIEYWSKRDFYVEYMCKKYEKMELMNKHGIMHARDLDYGEMRQIIVDRLKPLAELPIISLQRLKNNVSAKIESEFKQRKMPLSILGKQEETNRVMGYLELYRSKTEMKINMKSALDQYNKGKIKEDEYHATVNTLKRATEELENEIKQREEELVKLSSLNKKYNEIYN